MTDYDPTIPQASDNLSTSQGQMLNNFGQLNTLFDLNHFTWNDPITASRGLHRQIDFPDVSTPGAPSGLASVVYSKTVAGIASLFFRNAIGDSAVWRGGATNGLVSATTGGNSSSGTLNLPNGVQIKWGLASGLTDGDLVTFPAAFPVACFAVVICGNRDNTAERSLWVKPGYTRTGFRIRTDSSGINVQYIAVGN